MIIAKTKVRSATFDPNSIPSPNDGIPLMAAFKEIKASGKIEITAITMKPIVYFDNRKFSANRAEYFVDNVAPLMTIDRAAIKINKLLIIDFGFKMTLKRNSFYLTPVLYHNNKNGFLTPKLDFMKILSYNGNIN